MAEEEFNYEEMWDKKEEKERQKLVEQLPRGPLEKE